jgi:hypothetical protein
MSEAGDGTVELLAPVLCRCDALHQQQETKTTEQREARRFTASPLGCLVQFTHSGNSGWAGLVPTTRLLAQVTKAA